MPSKKRTGPGRRGLPHDFQFAHPAWMKPIFRDERRSESYSYTSESEDDEMLCLQDSGGWSWNSWWEWLEWLGSLSSNLVKISVNNGCFCNLKHSRFCEGLILFGSSFSLAVSQPLGWGELQRAGEKRRSTTGTRAVGRSMGRRRRRRIRRERKWRRRMMRSPTHQIQKSQPSPSNLIEFCFMCARRLCKSVWLKSLWQNFGNAWPASTSSIRTWEILTTWPCSPVSWVASCAQALGPHGAII